MKHEHFTKIHAMKKLTIIGLLVVIVVACLLLHWQHVKIARFDSDFRQHLAWSVVAAGSQYAMHK